MDDLKNLEELLEILKAQEQMQDILEHQQAEIDSLQEQLEESLKLFREGTALVEACGKLLDDAELQVKKIATAADGSPVEEAFEYEA